nr:hypothetical protein [uncultured Albidiferax sp.]
MKPAQIYTYTVPANGSVSIAVEGSFFKIITCTGPVSVSGDFGKLGPLLAGQGLKGRNSVRFMLGDMSGAANVVSILIADDGFIDDRISGEVSVIDGEKARSIAGSLFIGLPLAPAVAGQSSYCQLWNPLGSGVNLVVNQVKLNCNIASTVLFYWSMAAGNTDQTANQAASKKQGGAIPKAQIRVGSKAVATSFFAAPNLVANQELLVLPRGPFVVVPGSGLQMDLNVVNTLFSANFEWYEDPV